MASGAEFREIAIRRLKTVDILMDQEDWEAAVYMMALVLEIALKSAACMSLRLDSYPEGGLQTDDGYFMTHKFDRLLRISGCSDLFKITNNKDAFDNWSLFTGAFVFRGGDWVSMRYSPEMLANFTEEKAKELHKALNVGENSILKIMDKNKRW